MFAVTVDRFRLFRAAAVARTVIAIIVVHSRDRAFLFAERIFHRGVLIVEGEISAAFRFASAGRQFETGAGNRRKTLPEILMIGMIVGGERIRWRSEHVRRMAKVRRNCTGVGIGIRRIDRFSVRIVEHLGGIRVFVG